jgi:hypothetical protein
VYSFVLGEHKLRHRGRGCYSIYYHDNLLLLSHIHLKPILKKEGVRGVCAFANCEHKLHTGDILSCPHQRFYTMMFLDTCYVT